ncbi:MAG: hypothetical protein GXP62_13880, partial [Oligoflexia bacterium]|nr:hypothetical protein [Oligoflexia bacterium]
YGYSSDYYGYETLLYYYAKYGWYGTYYATASYDGTTFEYSWFSTDFYFYWADL